MDVSRDPTSRWARYEHKEDWDSGSGADSSSLDLDQLSYVSDNSAAGQALAFNTNLGIHELTFSSLL